MFWNFQVLVNFCPRGTLALSGIVTSSTRMALSLHAAADVTVGDGVNGSSVGEAVGGTSVGRVNPCFVGGRVEVTKRGGAFVAVSSETLMHELRMMLVSRMKIQIFFIS
jgi:acyl dehydratase